MFKSLTALAIIAVANANAGDECYTDVGVEICTSGNGDISVCGDAIPTEGSCWYGDYGSDGFIVGDEDGRGMACNWHGECVGQHAEEAGSDYDHDFFVVHGEEIHYPIGIEWIEDLVVDSARAILGGYCDHNVWLSLEYGAQVWECELGDDAWMAGVSLEEGFGLGTETSMIECSWEGDCWGYDATADYYEFCAESWAEVECE